MRRYGIPGLVSLLAVACTGGGGSPGTDAKSTRGGTSASPDATAAGAPGLLDADPGRLPKDRGAALDLIARVIADADDFGPGVIRSSPYESDPDRRPVLGTDCVWHLEKPAGTVLATLTRFFEVPAVQGKGPVRLSAVVTVHRTRQDARWEMAESLEETMRCPTQQLREGERIGSLFAVALLDGESANATSEDELSESGEFESTRLGGPHPYSWQQAQSLQFTVAVTGKGAKGRTEREISDLTAQAQSTMLVRLESAVEKQN